MKLTIQGPASELAGLLPSLGELFLPAPSVRQNFEIPVPSHLTTLAARYTKLDEDGDELPADSGDHAVLVDRRAGLMFDVRATHRGNHASCVKFAEASALLDRTWRLPTVEELFVHVSDRTRHEPARNPDLFPNLKTEWVWSGDADASDKAPSPVYAWGVYLSRGAAYLDDRSLVGLALPVCAWVPPAGQS